MTPGQPVVTTAQSDALFDVEGTNTPADPTEGMSADRRRTYRQTDALGRAYDTGRRPGGIGKQKCSWCSLTKPVGEFARSEAGWITRECRACEEERLECWARTAAAPAVRGRRYVDENASHLLCTRCGRSRPKSLFHVYTDGRSSRRYYRPKCKQCANAEQNLRKARHGISEERRRKNRDRWLWKQYGIGLLEFEFYLYCQDYRCGICGTTDPGGPTAGSAFHTDHVHASGRVRGLLCRSCNTAIGLLKEDPKLLAAAAAYLERGGVFEPDPEDEWPACRDYQPAEEATTS